MSLRPSNAAGKPVGTAAFRAQLAQCTAAAHRWNLQEHTCAASTPAPLPPCPSRTDAGYADFEEAYELGKAPKWTHPYLVTEEDIRGRNDREGTRRVPKEPDALTCAICLEDLDEKAPIETAGPFGREELEILQELTERRRAIDPNATKVCGHVFHKNCLARWIKKSNYKCPLCSQPIPNEVVTRIGQLPAGPNYEDGAQAGLVDADDSDDEFGPEPERVDIGPARATAELVVERIEEIFENADSWVDEDAPLGMETRELEQVIRDTITEAMSDSEQNPIFVEYILFSEYGDIMIQAAGEMGLAEVAAWLNQSRVQAQRAFLEIVDTLIPA